MMMPTPRSAQSWKFAVEHRLLGQRIGQCHEEEIEVDQLEHAGMVPSALTPAP